MGRWRDGALAAIALAGFLLGFVLVGASLSSPAFALGATGTLVFEVLAARVHGTVRQYWDRLAVQLASLAAAFALATVGTLIAPSSVLSGGIGALVTYLAVLAGVTFEDRRGG